MMRASRNVGLGVLLMVGLSCAVTSERVDAPTAATSAPRAPVQPLPGDAGEAHLSLEPSPLPPVEVRRISATPRTFVPGETEPLRLRFVTGIEVPLRVELRTEAGELVRWFAPASRGPEGTEVVWDGLDARGRPVPSGLYLYRILALDEEGRVRGSYGTGPSGAGEEVLAQRYTFDRDTGTLTFVLPEPARVRLRMGIQNLPILRTYYDWEPLEAGRHTIEWDGLDTTGKIRVVDHPAFRADLTARSLPPNAIYVRREEVNTQDPCVELCFRIVFPDVDAWTEDGLPLVDDAIRFRLLVDDVEERERLINSRFEIMIFLDTIYLFEEEDGAVPFTYRIDARGLNPGPHLLTVNVLAYDQRVGVQTLEFVKGPQSDRSKENQP